ncbi:helix-turn-helix transcriptional regulator [Clostridium felsineum]|uniref:helix-turn-helix domain-containing protein n=1 Tax=Clostridium felsineum TaxID=36839 RepID=UPI00214DC538|nr:helix-turn-helix transcriptional regulator [Clostridium felsineum]MCR3758503.1 helix-turn-helix transcriptional regulator [Clostridium felsineum]
MSTYEILPAGVKLKNLREKYKLLQDDLAGSEITRNLISQIEHGKARLTRHAAEVMLKNLKEICNRRNIVVDEDIDYLIEDEKSQANKVLDKNIKELKDLSVYKDGSFTHKLNEVENFTVNWNIPDKKIVIFELAGDYFFNANELYDSSMYYEKARALMDNNTYSDNLISILRKLSMVYFYMDKYDENIKCCDFALKQFKDMNKEYYCIFLYNSALCYIQLKEYKTALLRLRKLESFIKDINLDKYYEVLGQEGVCLQYLKKYNESLEIFNYILKSVNKNNHETYVIVLFNLADIYIELDDCDKAREYLKDISENIGTISQESKRVPDMYHKTGTIYKQVHDDEQAEVYFSKALQYAMLYKQYNVVSNVLNDLFDIYVVNKNYKGIDKIKNTFLLNINKEQKINLVFMNKIIEYYLQNGNVETLKEIHNIVKLYMEGRGCYVL